MKIFVCALMSGVLLGGSMAAVAQQRPPQPKTIPECRQRAESNRKQRRGHKSHPK